MSFFTLSGSMLCCALFGATPLAAQTPGLSAWKWPPGDDARVLSASQELTPSLAAGGGNYLLVWSDSRALYGAGPGTEQSGYDLYGWRLDSAGQPLEPSPFLISANYGHQRSPQVCWNGQDWLVVWDDQAAGAKNIVAARIAPGGQILDDPPVAVDAADTFSLTNNGSTWLVATESYSAGQGGIYGFRVAAGGAVLDPGGVLLVPENYYLYFNLRVAAAGGEYLLAWNDLNSPLAQRYTSDLQALGARLAAPSTIFTGNGSQYLFAYTDAASGSLRAQRWQSSGVVLDPGGVAVAALNPTWTEQLGAAWDGAQWWVSWRYGVDDTSLSRISAAGTVLDYGGFLVNGGAESPTAAQLAGAPGGGLRLAWLEYPAQFPSGYDLYTGSATAAGQPGPRAPLKTGTPLQMRPDLAAGAAGAWLTWVDHVSTVNKVMVARLDGFGNPLDPQPLEIASGSPYALTRSAVAWNGSYYFVVWDDATGVFGKRLRADGTVVDAQAIFVMPGSSPDVAALGDLFLVVADHYPGVYWEQRAVYGARVQGASGAVLDSPPLVLGFPFAQPPRVTTFAGRWLVTWQQNWSHNSTLASAAAAFVHADGTRPGSFGVGSLGYSPQVSASPTSALFVYGNGSPSTPYSDVVAVRLTSGGVLETPFPVAAGGYKEVEPAVTWTGANFLVAWEDFRHQQSYFDWRSDFYGARVTEDGILLDPAGFSLESERLPVAQAFLASFAGRSLLAAAVFRAAPYLGWRAGCRFIGAWSDLGNALAGSNGPPLLDAQGEIVAGQSVTWSLTRARPGAAGAFVAGRSRVDRPYFGGILVPAPERLDHFVTSAQGGAELVLVVPISLPPGSQVYLQAWLLDPLAPQGRAASNALMAVVP